MKTLNYCSAKIGTWLTQSCGARAKFAAKGLHGPIYLCGTHAAMYRRQGWQEIERLGQSSQTQESNER